MLRRVSRGPPGRQHPDLRGTPPCTPANGIPSVQFLVLARGRHPVTALFPASPSRKHPGQVTASLRPPQPCPRRGPGPARVSSTPQPEPDQSGRRPLRAPRDAPMNGRRPFGRTRASGGVAGPLTPGCGPGQLPPSKRPAARHEQRRGRDCRQRSRKVSGAAPVPGDRAGEAGRRPPPLTCRHSASAFRRPRRDPLSSLSET